MESWEGNAAWIILPRTLVMDKSEGEACFLYGRTEDQQGTIQGQPEGVNEYEIQIEPEGVLKNWDSRSSGRQS